MEQNDLKTDSQSAATLGSDWWRGAVIYQIYPRSFCDGNGDGVGDLPGIFSKLEYVADLGVDAIWLSPFFCSPMKDFGYDISNYRDVDPLFGTLDDFVMLVEKAHALGVRVIIDQVLSHTSDQHPWFLESRQSADNQKSHFYVWADARPDGTPPNNWLSVFGGSAWTWSTQRRQYYLHNFLDSQPDLNFHNAKVQDQVLSDVEFWLKLGVDGLRLDACNFYFHDKELRNNPPVKKSARRTRAVDSSNPYSFQSHIFDICRPENLTFHRKLRALLERYPGTTSVGEIGADDSLAVMSDYLRGNDKLFMAYTFDLLTTSFDAQEIHSIVTTIEEGLHGGWPCLAFSNHDVVRAISRLSASPGKEKALLLLALLTCLRGSVCLYQGEELMLTQAEVPFQKLQDPYGIRFWPEFKGRDGSRTPMPWQHDKPNGGFSEVEPWLPLPEDHLLLARDLQEQDQESVLQRTRRFLLWRKGQPALVKGDFAWLTTKKQGLLFERRHKTMRLIVALNLSDTSLEFHLKGIHLEPMEGHGFLGAWHRKKQTIHLPPWQAFFGIAK